MRAVIVKIIEGENGNFHAYTDEVDSVLISPGMTVGDLWDLFRSLREEEAVERE